MKTKTRSATRSTTPKSTTSKSSLQPKAKVSSSRLLILSAIFAVVGIVALVSTFAINGSSGDFEAESMSVEALQ